MSSGRKGKGTTLFTVLRKANDPCDVAGINFPAFVFLKGSGTTQQVYVADATGTCTKPLFMVTDGYSAGASLSFSYPVNGSKIVAESSGSRAHRSSAGISRSPAPT